MKNSLLIVLMGMLVGGFNGFAVNTAYAEEAAETAQNKALHFEGAYAYAATSEQKNHHIMLIGLNRALKAGESFPLTLISENNGEMSIDVAIKNPGAPE